MNIGIPKERRPFEYRVGLPPAGVSLFHQHGHKVYVETGAGDGAGFADGDYTRAGATVVYSPEEVFTRADLVLKFARPLLDEIERMHTGQAIAGFLHLSAARQDKIDLLLRRKIASLAYDQIEEPDGFRPVVAPLSQIGGRMAVQVAALLLQNNMGGRGILLGGVVGVPPAEVVIIGAGIVGSSAAAGFAAAGAHVTILDVDLRRLQELQARLRGPLVTLLSTPHNLARATSYADILVGAALVHGRRAPIVVSREMVRGMRPRSLIIDMSIDEGGCVETSRPTNYSSPTYVEEGVIHFCVPNMSGVLGRTATHALYSGAYPYLEAIARLGLAEAAQAMPAMERGLCTFDGQVRNLKRLTGASGGAG
ncbi:MAG TPA: alanine dehydrogenase [Anaerolineales bacterium]|nr:alanine dehydrogenase [Anaerolineales bacterium]